MDLVARGKNKVALFGDVIVCVRVTGIARVVLLVKYVPKMFSSENGQKWCFE